MEEKEEIRKLYFRKRWSIRKIARELHHSRKTVRRALNDLYPPVSRRKVPPPERVLGRVKHIIHTYIPILNRMRKGPKSKGIPPEGSMTD